ncbi:MAG: hypothetical protein KKA05_02535, partial [Alphaproteobacteria bacterium]|nr:hypothetical protein [Alphaproteobacteria bacterium]
VTYKPVKAHDDKNYCSFPTEDDFAAGEQKGVRMIGTPHEMVEIYTAIFGNKDILRSKILNAIYAYESQAQTGATVAIPEQRPVRVASMSLNSR